jgi:mRNA-degrading endonuclease RelE of RelBE toxin-antitoxin system
VRYIIEFAACVEEHLAQLSASERTRALNVIEERLRHEPLIANRSRKPLRPNTVAPWELRIGSLRVFYEAKRATVRILAIGKKKRDALRIGGREIKL